MPSASVRKELRLIDPLLRAEDKDGVIGSSARANLRQVPSMIYWQGLARWGIRRVEGTPLAADPALRLRLGCAHDPAAPSDH